MWKNSEFNAITFEKPIMLRFPISVIETRVVLTETTHEKTMQTCIDIGSKTYYLKSTDNIKGRLRDK